MLGATAVSQPPSHNGQHVRRVVLPSGREIEVVYFESAGSVENLHVCPDCHRDLVYPVEWEEASPTHWEVLLRCPNCEWRDVGRFDQPTVDRFDEQLDLGIEALTHDLRRLQRANMEEEIELFVSALRADAILPEDFQL
jgi:hypothetical protein